MSIKEDPFVLMLLNITVIAFIQLGILVKSTLVFPDALIPPEDILVIKLAPIVGVPPNVGLLIVGLDNVALDNAALLARTIAPEPVDVVPPVPPEATGNGLDSPVIVPPVIATLLAFWVDIVPSAPVAVDTAEVTN